MKALKRIGFGLISSLSILAVTACGNTEEEPVSSSNIIDSGSGSGSGDEAQEVKIYDNLNSIFQNENGFEVIVSGETLDEESEKKFDSRFLGIDNEGVFNVYYQTTNFIEDYSSYGIFDENGAYKYEINEYGRFVEDMSDMELQILNLFGQLPKIDFNEIPNLINQLNQYTQEASSQNIDIAPIVNTVNNLLNEYFVFDDTNTDPSLIKFNLNKEKLQETVTAIDGKKLPEIFDILFGEGSFDAFASQIVTGLTGFINSDLFDSIYNLTSPFVISSGNPIAEQVFNKAALIEMVAQLPSMANLLPALEIPEMVTQMLPYIDANLVVEGTGLLDIKSVEFNVETTGEMEGFLTASAKLKNSNDEKNLSFNFSILNGESVSTYGVIIEVNDLEDQNGKDLDVTITSPDGEKSYCIKIINENNSFMIDITSGNEAICIFEVGTDSDNNHVISYETNNRKIIVTFGYSDDVLDITLSVIREINTEFVADVTNIKIGETILIESFNQMKNEQINVEIRAAEDDSIKQIVLENIKSKEDLITELLSKKTEQSIIYKSEEIQSIDYENGTVLMGSDAANDDYDLDLIFKTAGETLDLRDAYMIELYGNNLYATFNNIKPYKLSFKNSGYKIYADIEYDLKGEAMVVNVTGTKDGEDAVIPDEMIDRVKYELENFGDIEFCIGITIDENLLHNQNQLFI